MFPQELQELQACACDSFVVQGAALGAMVGQMTYGKRQFENLDGVMRRLIPPFHQAMNELLLMVDTDASAFNSYMVRKIPQSLSRVVFQQYSTALALTERKSAFKLLFIFFLLQAALKMPKNTEDEIKRSFLNILQHTDGLDQMFNHFNHTN